MEWATLVWMGGMTVIAVAVERRTSRLEKKLDERQNKTRDAQRSPINPIAPRCNAINAVIASMAARARPSTQQRAEQRAEQGAARMNEAHSPRPSRSLARASGSDRGMSAKRSMKTTVDAE